MAYQQCKGNCFRNFNVLDNELRPKKHTREEGRGEMGERRTRGGLQQPRMEKKGEQTSTLEKRAGDHQACQARGSQKFARLKCHMPSLHKHCHCLHSSHLAPPWLLQNPSYAAARGAFPRAGVTEPRGQAEALPAEDTNT